MRVVMFQRRFAELVAHGKKTQTIRPPRKRPLLDGEEISLRVWSEKPYRSPQIEIAQGRVMRGLEIWIDRHFVVTREQMAEGRQIRGLDAFAVRDGFVNWQEMEEWFARTHGLPFHGCLIEWVVTWKPSYEIES